MIDGNKDGGRERARGRTLLIAPRDFAKRLARPFQQSKIPVPRDGRDVVRIGEEESSDYPVAAIWGEVERLYAIGLHPAIALCIHRRGKVVLDRTIGHVQNDTGPSLPGAVATPDTLFSLFSASKMMTAMVVHGLVEDGVLGLEDRAVKYVPELARHGKEAIRIRHLLNHTAGIPNMPSGLDPEEFLTRGQLSMELLADLVPTHPPGVNVAYHPVTAWLILAEIVQRATDRNLRELLRERFLDPLGFQTLDYGVPLERIGDVAKHAMTGPKLPAVLDRIFERTLGVGLDRLELTNGTEFLTGIHPSANVIGTAREAGRFMELLRRGGELDGVRVLREETVRRAITEVTPLQLDSTFGFPMRYGLGTMMGGDMFSLFGLGTRGAFGHLGLSNVVVYADPRRETSVAFLNTGKPVVAPGMLRWAAALQRIVMAAGRV